MSYFNYNGVEYAIGTIVKYRLNFEDIEYVKKYIYKGKEDNKYVFKYLYGNSDFIYLCQDEIDTNIIDIVHEKTINENEDIKMSLLDIDGAIEYIFIYILILFTSLALQEICITIFIWIISTFIIKSWLSKQTGGGRK